MFRKLWRHLTAIKDPWGIHVRFYACLGILAAEWSRVEELLSCLIFLAIDVEPAKGEFLLANIGFQSKIHLLNAELHVYRDVINAPKEMVEDMETILKELSDLYPKRNYYIHSFYVGGSGEQDAETRVLRIKGKIRNTSRVVTLFEIYDTYERIFHLRNRLAKLVQKFDTTGRYHDKPHLEDVPPEILATPSLDPTSSISPSPFGPSKA
jgi:hypothetical protein